MIFPLKPPFIIWLVVLTILKNLKVNGKDDIPYMKWKIKNVWKHQPVNIISQWCILVSSMTVHNGYADRYAPICKLLTYSWYLMWPNLGRTWATSKALIDDDVPDRSWHCNLKHGTCVLHNGTGRMRAINKPHQNTRFFLIDDRPKAAITEVWLGFPGKISGNHWVFPAIYTGWWFFAYPSEKYEFVTWDDEIPNWMEK